MDKENYLTELEEYLDALTADEKADVIEFYNEYIDDAGLETTDEIEKSLGTPRQLSRKVLADYSIKATDVESHRSKKSKASVRYGSFKNRNSCRKCLRHNDRNREFQQS